MRSRGGDGQFRRPLSPPFPQFLLPTPLCGVGRGQVGAFNRFSRARQFRMKVCGRAEYSRNYYSRHMLHFQQVLVSMINLRLILVVLGAVLLTTPTVIAQARANVGSLRILQLADDNVLTTSRQAFCRENEPMTFSEMVWSFMHINASGYDREKSCFDKQVASLSQGRQMILSVHEAELYWRLGSHERACQQLQSFNARFKIIQLAQRSVAQKDMEATALYLDCFDGLGGGVSHPAAMLYRQLGIYYKARGWSVQAFQAYERAAARYPGIWAEPYIVQSDILWQQNQRDLSIRLLENALARSTDATTTFQLARTLGLRLEEMGQWRSAYCAMQKALQVEAQVPLNNASPGSRLDLRDRVERLKNIIDLDASAKQGLCDD
jgi:tetratricopeptide (TPR) repeat protein